MPHDAETIRLWTKTLGVEPKSPAYWNLVNKHSREHHRNAYQINQELVQMNTVSNRAQQIIEIWLENNGLKMEQVQHRSWDPSCLTMDIKTKIAGITPPPNDTHYLNYEGRDIEFRFATRASNNNWHIADIVNLFESKFASARTLHPRNEIYQKAVEALYTKYHAELNKLLEEIETLRESNKAELELILEKCEKLHRRLICEIGVALARAERLDPLFNPNEAQIEEQVLGLQKQENFIHSKKRRPIIINAYPQETKDAKTAQWIIEMNIPKSDISSANRSLDDLMISNWWHVENYVVEFAQQADGHYDFKSSKLRDEFDRSSSSAQLTDEDHATRREKEVAAFRRMIVQDARDMLVKAINSGKYKDKPIPKELTVKTAYITMLSPFIEQETGKAIESITPDSAKAKTITENENAQLDALEYSAAKVQDELLKFQSEDDIKYILQHTHGKITRQQIEAIGISQDNFAGNYVVNAFLGLNMENLDWGKLNKSYNQRGIEKLHIQIKKFLEQFTTGKYGSLISLFDPSKVEKSWDKTKGRLLDQRIRLKAAKEAPEIVELIECYIKLQDYWHNLSDGNGRLVQSFLAVANMCRIAAILDFKAHLTCKSGKDRTGLAIAIKEALLGDDELVRVNICNALKYFAGKELNARNLPGCRGMQITSTILSELYEINGHSLLGYPEDIQKLIREECIDRIGKLGKTVYECHDEMHAYVKKHKPTDSRTRSAFTTLRAALSSSTSAFFSSTTRSAPAVVLDPPPKPKTESPTAESYTKPTVTAASLQKVKLRSIEITAEQAPTRKSPDEQLDPAAARARFKDREKNNTFVPIPPDHSKSKANRRPSSTSTDKP